MVTLYTAVSSDAYKKDEDVSFIKLFIFVPSPETETSPLLKLQNTTTTTL